MTLTSSECVCVYMGKFLSLKKDWKTSEIEKHYLVWYMYT